MLYSNAILDALYTRANDPRFADKTAVQQIGGKKLSYRQLIVAVDALATWLVSEGFTVGDRALLLIRPSVDTMVIVLAVIRAGGAVIVGDPAMGKEVFESRLRFARPKWVFTERIILWLLRFPFLQRLLKLNLPDVRKIGAKIILPSPPSPLSLMARGDSLNKVRDDSSELMIVFTSGTTGEPKGVVHSQRSVFATLETVSDTLKLTENDVLYSYALHLTIPALLAGASAVLPPRKNSAKASIEAYRRYGITKTFDVPSQMKEIVSELKQRGEKLPDTLEMILLGAAPVFADFLQDLRSVFGAKTQAWAVYGMTEILPACAVSLEEKLAFDRREGDLVGRPLKGIHAKIAKDGELILSGEGLFRGYLGQEAVTQHPTGDYARLDNGRIVLLGRKKDMIIRGNFNLYPSLYEPTIREIEGVEDCAFVGIYSPEKADERVILFVQGTIPEEKLRIVIKSGEYSIDEAALPDFIFYGVIPYSGRSRKLDRKALRELAREKLGIAVLEDVLK